jgi:REP element-mobilizing transposase RayT
MIQSPFLDRREVVEEWKNDLPHWHQPLRFQFVTWCLGDALPGRALKRLKRERARWIEAHPHPWSPLVQADYYDRFHDRVDRWLEVGRGEMVFRNPEYANVMADVLLFHEGSKTRMDSFVVMPNHVHVLVQLIGDTRLSDVMHSWRGYSAQELNRRRGKKGRFWSEDYWDRVIRSPRHYWRVRKYIRDNPVKAGLPQGTWLLWMRDPPLWEDLKAEGVGVRSESGALK